MITPEEQKKIFEEHYVEEKQGFEQADEKTEAVYEDEMIDDLYHKKYATKIIIANKIAESSITINGVTVVIDTGLAKEASYDPIRKITSIETESISKAQATQRRGRAGRTSPGICYRIFSEEEFNRMDPDKEPEIKRTNLDTVILKILGLGIHVQDFSLIEKLDERAVENGYQYLEQIEAIKNKELTEKGQIMADFPLEPGYANVVLQGFKRDCWKSVLKIISILPFAGQIFFRSKDKKPDTDLVKGFKAMNSDLEMFEAIFDSFLNLKYNEKRKWCVENSLSNKSLSQSVESYKELEKDIFNASKSKTNAKI